MRSAFVLILRRATAAVGVFLVLQPGPVLGCAACFGRSDSTLAKGMNMGILSLLGVITCVLLGVAGFFVFLARQGARAAAAHSVPVSEVRSEAVSRS